MQKSDELGRILGQHKAGRKHGVDDQDVEELSEVARRSLRISGRILTVVGLYYIDSNLEDKECNYEIEKFSGFFYLAK